MINDLIVRRSPYKYPDLAEAPGPIAKEVAVSSTKHFFTLVAAQGTYLSDLAADSTKRAKCSA